MKLRYNSHAISEGCRALRKTTGGLILKQRNSRYRPNWNHLLVNWGSSTFHEWFNAVPNILNHPYAVAKASNKLITLQTLQQEYVNGLQYLGIIPEFTTDRDDAEDWIHEGKTVYCRTLLQGHSGQGIVIATCEEELVNAPLYTLGFDANHEYRVHVFQGRVIDVVKKSRRRDENPSRLIRNYSSGWVFIRNYESVIPSWVKDICIDAVRLLGLDFGAVDVGYNQERDRACIYEVNTAPGMEFNSQTCKNYADAIRAYCATMD